ncbi:MAG: ATP-grasp domain-containing protein [Eggerthellaceae bacterium]
MTTQQHNHRLVILGSMHEFVELVRVAQARGIYVIVCDGYDDGPAKLVADKSYTINVRDTDAIAQMCKDEQVDGIVASFSDLLAECLVNIADKAGLPCYCTPEKFANLREKNRMKRMFAALDIPTPSCIEVHKETIAQDIAKVGLPCVVKPVNGYGSRGIYRFTTLEEIEAHFDEIASYSSFDYILAEHYNSGYEFNMMSWIVDGKPCVISIADREKSVEVPDAIPHVSRVAYPSRLISEVYDEACSIVEKVAGYVGMSEGPLSMQFFYTPDADVTQGESRLQVCEVAGRLFGYEHELVTLASGLSIEELLIDYVYDKPAMKKRMRAHSPFFTSCSAGLYFHGHEGKVAQVITPDVPGNVSEILDYYAPGECIKHGVGAKPYVVRYYLTAADRATLDTVTEQLFSDVRVLDPRGNNLLYRNQMTRY